MTNRISLLLLVPAVVTTSTTAAWAAPTATDAAAPAAVIVQQPASPTSPAAADPNIDRGFLQPTALTQPAGSLTYNNYELLLHGLTYGITDRVQVSATVLAPLVSQMPFVGVASVKWQFLSAARLHLALQGSGTMLHVALTESDAPSGTVSNNVFLVGAGAFASYCLREDCSSLASLSATYQLALDGGGSTSSVVVYGGSIVHRVAQHVKLLGEITSAAGGTGTSNLDNVSGALASYGVRFHNANLASDIGFMKPIFTDSSEPFLLGLPFINVSYRWN